MDQSIFYRRNLPHWQPPDATFFVTYRLAGSIPMNVINTLKENYTRQKGELKNQSQERRELIRQEYFTAFDNELEKNLNEPHWLKSDSVANVVMQSLFFNNEKQYKLWGACIMSNHVHKTISTYESSPLLQTVLQNHKKFTAVTCNKILKRSGKFWAEESFDTIIRNNNHFFNVIRYIINNPVKAGLVKNWNDWKWTYLDPGLREDFILSLKNSKLNY